MRTLNNNNNKKNLERNAEVAVRVKVMRQWKGGYGLPGVIAATLSEHFIWLRCSSRYALYLSGKINVSTCGLHWMVGRRQDVMRKK
jgi:hypothetical protein